MKDKPGVVRKLSETEFCGPFPDPQETGKNHSGGCGFIQSSRVLPKEPSGSAPRIPGNFHLLMNDNG